MADAPGGGGGGPAERHMLVNGRLPAFADERLPSQRELRAWDWASQHAFWQQRSGAP
jgi:hypothetical protein